MFIITNLPSSGFLLFFFFQPIVLREGFGFWLYKWFQINLVNFGKEEDSLLKIQKLKIDSLRLKSVLKQIFLSHRLLVLLTSYFLSYCCCLCQWTVRFHLFLLTIANRNWQKMCHRGSPANKRCAILRAGMFAIVTMATN